MLLGHSQKVCGVCAVGSGLHTGRGASQGSAGWSRAWAYEPLCVVH